jgi:2'-5' RNA ligase
MMRTFLALELPGETAMQIADWRDRQFGPVGRAVPPANFHITLAFIGELSEGRLERLCLATDEWLAGAGPAGGKLLLNCTGYWAKPGIYWLGPDEWPEALSQLAGKLRQLATAAGARRDRNSFRPHVTLFRNCSTAPPVTAPAISLPYSHFTLYESRQGKTGVSYHPLQHWELSPPERLTEH